MYLAKSDLLSVVKKQYLYKLHSNLGLFLGLIITHIVGILFSITTISTSSMGSNSYSVNIVRLSSQPIAIFSHIFIVILAIFLNTKEFKNIDFIYVGNRLSSSLSDIAFIATFSSYASFSTVLSGFVMRTAKFMAVGSSNIVNEGFLITPMELVIGFVGTFLYLMLFASFTYFCSVLLCKSKLFAIVIMCAMVLSSRTTLLTNIFKFYGHESNVFNFTVKVLIAVIPAFAASIFVYNNMEVRQ
jgi:hypothetical protein